jgi:hypothetical protein
MHLRIIAACIVLSGLVPLVGCGAGPAKLIVSGRVVQNGRPLAYVYPGLTEVFFVPTDGSVREMHPAAVEPDGTFTVHGKDGFGIAPGQYRICVTWRRHYPQGIDLLRGRFDLTHSRIIRDVQDEGEVVIDVAKPEG